MSDFTALSTTTAYATLLADINARLLSLAKQLDDGSTNLPADAIKFNKAAKKWQKWSGSAWVDAADIYDITVSASKLLTQLLTVDGPASGLDADTLDGYHAASFLLASSYTAADVLAKLLTVDGATSLLDADKLDGQEGSYYRNADQVDGYHAADLRVPAGAVEFFAMNVAPAGWLKCNGATINRTTYAALFTAIGTTFGAGDGSTTFKLPDLRGEFLRGWDDARGVDSGRVFGSSMLDALQGHFHRVISANNNPYLGKTSGAAAGGLGFYNEVANLTDFGIVNAKDLYTDGTNGTPRTAAETRPRNIALLACIKY